MVSNVQLIWSDGQSSIDHPKQEVNIRMWAKFGIPRGYYGLNLKKVYLQGDKLLAYAELEKKNDHPGWRIDSQFLSLVMPIPLPKKFEDLNIIRYLGGYENPYEMTSKIEEPKPLSFEESFIENDLKSETHKQPIIRIKNSKSFEEIVNKYIHEPNKIHLDPEAKQITLREKICVTCLAAGFITSIAFVVLAIGARPMHYVS